MMMSGLKNGNSMMSIMMMSVIKGVVATPVMSSETQAKQGV